MYRSECAAGPRRAKKQKGEAMSRTWSALSVVALLALAATARGQAQQVAAAPAPVQQVVNAISNIGTRHEKVLEDLLNKNQPEDAARYWGENRSYFWDNAAQLGPLLARLKSAVNTPYEARMSAAEAALKPFSTEPKGLLEWANVIRALSAAKLELDSYRALPIAIDDSLRSDRFISLDGVVSDVTQLYIQSAPQAFAQYDHFNSPPFNRTYPVDVPDDVIAAGYLAVKPRLETASADQIAKFTDAYGKVLTATQRDELARYASAARFRELMPGGRMTAEAAAKLISDMLAGKLDPATLPVRFAFYWSRDAAKSGEVPVALKAPASISVSEIPRRDIAARLAEADVAVYIDVDRPRLMRDTKNTRREYSHFKSSERQVLNPAYLDAQALVQQKQLEQMRAESGGGLSFSLNPIDLAVGLAKEGYKQAKTMTANKNLKQAQDALANTPRMLAEDVMADYQYTISDVEVTRKIPLAVYLIDVKSGNYLKQTTEVTEKERFDAVDDLHPRDPDRDQILAKFPPASKVQEYIATPVNVDAAVVLNAALGVVHGDVAMQPVAALAQDIERGAVQSPLASVMNAALAAPGSCDAYFDSFVEQLKVARCAAEAENLKGFVEAIGGPTRSVAETGILSTSRTPELYKSVPTNDERWVTAGESAQPNCGTPLAVRNPSDAFMECVRMLSCAARTAACGRELTRQNKSMGCPEASQRCMVVYPIPQ